MKDMFFWILLGEIYVEDLIISLDGEGEIFVEDLIISHVALGNELFSSFSLIFQLSWGPPHVWGSE